MADTSKFLGMSDEEFLNTSPPDAETTTETVVTEPETSTETTVEGGTENTEATTTTEETTTSKETEGGDTTAVVEDDKTKVAGKDATTKNVTTTTKEKPAATTTKVEGEKDPKDVKDAGKDTSKTTITAELPPDYKALYEEVLAPFKANGRNIEMKTPKEVRQLMQMGANYTRKMQELAPHRRVLTMLQDNNLMDEGTLSYLIDLHKKDPNAIKKLVKDAGIDPSDIDTNVEPAYRQGNHRVSDERVAFASALEDMKSTPEHFETLKTINDGWDQASKEALWKQPEIMRVIHGQRESGVYDRIANEVSRLQTIGDIPSNVPFLQAYKTVGDQMTQAGKLADLTTKTVPVKQPEATVITTRVEAPKPKVTNDARAKSASASRQTSTSTAKPFKNPLAMSDEAFLKEMEGRV